MYVTFTTNTGHFYFIESVVSVECYEGCFTACGESGVWHNTSEPGRGFVMLDNGDTIGKFSNQSE